MNLEDVLDPEYGLQQDEWSLSKPTFGEEGQPSMPSNTTNDKKKFERSYTCSVCSTSYITTRYSKNRYCSKACSNSKRKKVNITTKQKVYCKRFIIEGGFDPATKFKILGSSVDIEAPGNGTVWEYTCVECGQVALSTTSCLIQGKRSCMCSLHRQKEAYINWLIDNNNMAVAIKFGIARDSKQRIKQQDSKSAYTLKQHSIYSFPDVASCKKAERDCKKELDCGVVLKRDMPDGYSETTWAYNIGKVKDIYERNGGVML